MLLKAFVLKTLAFFKNICEKYVLFLLYARQKLRTTLIVFFFREGHFFYSKSKSNFKLRFTMCDF